MSVNKTKTLTLPLLNTMEADRLLKIIWTLLTAMFRVLHLVEVFQGKMYKYFDIFFFPTLYIV